MKLSPYIPNTTSDVALIAAKRHAFADSHFSPFRLLSSTILPTHV